MSAGGHLCLVRDGGYLWMACYTQQEIAHALNITHPTVSNFVKFSEFGKTYKNPDLDDDSEDDDNAEFFVSRRLRILSDRFWETKLLKLLKTGSDTTRLTSCFNLTKSLYSQR